MSSYVLYLELKDGSSKRISGYPAMKAALKAPAWMNAGKYAGNPVVSCELVLDFGWGREGSRIPFDVNNPATV